MEILELFQDFKMISFLSSLFFIITTIIIAKITYRIKLVTENPDLFEKNALFFCIFSLVFSVVLQASVEPIIEVTMSLTNNKLLLALSPLPLFILLIISFEIGAGYVSPEKAWISKFNNENEIYNYLKDQNPKNQEFLIKKHKQEIIEKFPNFNSEHFLKDTKSKLLIIEKEEY